ncbi:MAG: hypothetical protein AB8I08_25085 [Sandaracinaceae bacterium]
MKFLSVLGGGVAFFFLTALLCTFTYLGAPVLPCEGTGLSQGLTGFCSGWELSYGTGWEPVGRNDAYNLLGFIVRAALVLAPLCGGVAGLIFGASAHSKLKARRA